MLLSILFIAVLLFSIQWYSLNRSLRFLTYRSELDRALAECGEVFSMKTVLQNTGWFPLLFLRTREYVPREAVFEETEKAEGSRTAGQQLSDTVVEEMFYILPHQEVARTMRLSLSRRGRYVFGSARVTAGDFFGIDSRTEPFSTPQEIIVYPKRTDLEDWMPKVDDYLGNISVLRFILPDPIETIGYREYTGREPMKDISWPKSLSSGQLTVRQFDHFSDLKACILVNVESALPQEIEYVYSVARTLAEELEKKHIPFSFHTNAYIASSGVISSSVMSGSGSVHLRKVLELLGRASYEKTEGLERLIVKAAGSRDVQKAYLLISAAPVRPDVLKRCEQRYGIRILSLERKETHEDTGSD